MQRWWLRRCFLRDSWWWCDRQLVTDGGAGDEHGWQDPYGVDLCHIRYNVHHHFEHGIGDSCTVMRPLTHDGCAYGFSIVDAEAKWATKDFAVSGNHILQSCLPTLDVYTRCASSSSLQIHAKADCQTVFEVLVSDPQKFFD